MCKESKWGLFKLTIDFKGNIFRNQTGFECQMEKRHKQKETKRLQRAAFVCVDAPVAVRNVRAATALLGSGAADALSDAFDNGFI